MKKIFFYLLLQTVGLLNADINFTYTTDSYATHQLILYKIARETSGPIIEFGCGNGSTNLLHELCKQTGRTLVSLDDDFLWLKKFATKYLHDGYEEDNSGWHKFYFVPGKQKNENPAHWVEFLKNFDLLNTIDFEVAFVDQSPWLARYETIVLIKDTIPYILLHDCDYFATHNILGTTITPTNYTKNIPGAFDFGKHFLYFTVYFPPYPWAAVTGPPTLLASNMIDVSTIEV
jgi:hypothetical protein